MRSRSGGTNFHQHSDASLLDGASTCAQIFDRCAELGFKYVCISDHGNVANHVQAYDDARGRGLIPVLGSEIYMRDPKYDNGKRKGFHLTLWAMNEVGLHNLWAISSRTYYATGDGHRNPDAQWGYFDGLGEGVVCTSACLAGALSVAADRDDEDMALYFAERYASVFDDFYIELHTNSMPEQRRVNLWLCAFAQKHGYKTVYAVDSHYALKDDGEFHDVWLGCQTKAYFDEEHWKMAHEYYVQGEDEVSERLAYIGDDELRKCFDGIDDFLSKVEEYELDMSLKIPKYPLPEGWDDSGEYFKWLVARGLLSKCGGCELLENEPGDPLDMIRYKVIDGEKFVGLAECLPQLFDEEISLILKHDLQDYFLIVADYCKWSKERMLVGPGRGSCAASLVCYCLDITEIDPRGKGLIFSRFLSEARVAKGMPDVDEDFPMDKKHLVHDYLRDKYGEEYVTAVGLVLLFGIKLAVKEICRYYRIPFNDSNRLTSIVEELEEMAVDGDWKAQIPNLDESDKAFVNNYLSNYPDLFSKAERMVGLARSYGKHAAGYVVSPYKLEKWLPIRKSSNDEIITQFDKVAVERLGFLKADILGLRNLTTYAETAKLVKQRHGVDIDFYHLEDDPDDDAVWRIFRRGKNLGVFQMESAGISSVAMELCPRSVSDLSTIVALYRPGVLHAKMPDGTGMLEEYIARAHGEKPVVYLHPLLEPILKGTYGVCIAKGSMVMTVQGEIPIEDIKVGDMLMTECGEFRKCTDAWSNGIRETVVVRTDFGEEIRCTPNHLLLTDRGWVRADELAENDLVKGIGKKRREIEPFNELDWLHGLFLADGCSGSTGSTPTIAVDSKEHAEIIKDVVLRNFPEATKTRVYSNGNGLGVTWYVSIADGEKRFVNGHRDRSTFNKFLTERGVYRKTRNYKRLGQHYSFSTLIGFFEGDGCYKNKRTNLANKELAKDIYNALQEYGVHCSFYQRDENAWAVSISDLQGFGGLFRDFNGHPSRGGYVPAIAVEKYVPEMNYLARKNTRKAIRNRRPIGINTLLDRGMNPEHLSEIHLYWGRVLSVKKAAPIEVFDLTVEGEHNFVVGRHVVHNCVFQEQTMRIFTDLAGFTDEEADDIRAAIGKKKIEKMEKTKPHYFEGCAQNGVSHEVAQQIWEQVEASASYAFNLAHSLSYATITFWSAWLKGHYFIEYFTACMSTVPFDKAVKYMQEARRNGISIVPPVLSSLTADYSILSDDEIAFGLENVKHVGAAMVGSILSNAPYDSFEDFVDRSGANKTAIEAMINVGVFRELYPNRRDLLARYRSGDFRDNLFGAALSDESRVVDELPDYSESELQEIETRLLGMPLTVDPFEKYRSGMGALAETLESLDDVESAGYDTPHVLLVRVTDVKLHQARGGVMAFLKFQTDGDEEMECTCFAKMWAASQQFVKEGRYLRVEVMKQKYKGGASYVLSKVQKLV